MEHVVRDTPLGIRLRDALDGRRVGDVLEVIASPAARPGAALPDLDAEAHRERRWVRAQANHAGVWVFPEPLGARAERWHVEVRDPAGRFLPLRLLARVGPEELLVPAAPLRFGAEPLLFSAPGRVPEPPVAVVRASFWDPIGARPAPWVLVEVTAGSAAPAWGLSDGRGELAVFLDHPELGASRRAGSGSDFGRGHLFDVRWDVQLRAFWAREPAPPRVPDPASLADRPEAALWSSWSGREPLGPQTLRYGAELVVRSTDVAAPPRAVRVTAGT
jgi:hypothetical protein